jgi:uncharacterized protein
MNRRKFLCQTSLAAAVAAWGNVNWAKETGFPDIRILEGKRKFQSEAVERAIRQIDASVGNRELAWLFGNCFPNTLDTTVDFEVIDGRPDTYVITGDIDAMWLRDSTAQVWPYLPLMKDDPRLQQLIAGVINRQTACILKDPYANAFYKNENQVSPWKSDRTEMKPGVHERKWEVDSLCYPVRLAYHYWKTAGDASPFDAQWRKAVALIGETFRQQQRKSGNGPYRFQRSSGELACSGYGNPARPVGLIRSMFRPSDDPTIFPYLIPSNFFAVASLRQAGEMLEKIFQDADAATGSRALADEVENALRQYAVVSHPEAGRVYAFEVDGYGSCSIMDDANVPNLLSLPYLGAVGSDDPIYQATRRLMLSEGNPYYVQGKAGEGLSGPHVGRDMIWPLGIIIRALTSTDEKEIRSCLATLQKTHAGTGFMHEAFHKDNPQQFTRSWFAWANTLFGELILKVHKERPHLLD